LRLKDRLAIRMQCSPEGWHGRMSSPAEGEL
jgi:hypothetical protein